MITTAHVATNNTTPVAVVSETAPDGASANSIWHVKVRCTSDFYVGPAGITSGTGYLVKAAEVFETDIADGDSLYVLASVASDTAVVYAEKVSRRG